MSRVTKNGLMLGCYNLVKKHAPVRKGNLKQSIRLKSTKEGFVIEITAPYTVYTEEQWLHPRWNGKQNPNQGWIIGAVADITMYLQSRIDGKFDFDDTMKFDDYVGKVVRDYQQEQYDKGVYKK